MWGHCSQLEHLHVCNLLAASCLPSQPWELQLQSRRYFPGASLGGPYMGTLGPSLVQRSLSRDLQLGHRQGEAAFMELSSFKFLVDLLNGNGTCEAEQRHVDGNFPNEQLATLRQLSVTSRRNAPCCYSQNWQPQVLSHCACKVITSGKCQYKLSAMS